MGVTFIAKEGTYTAPATLTTKTITENGTYSAVDDSANGYSSVTVEVEGGGGSSDFSTAEVTIVNTLEEEISVFLPVLGDNVLSTTTDIGAGETQVLKMPIPTGGAYVAPTVLLGTVSGDIAFKDGILTITGDGTFTVTGLD